MSLAANLFLLAEPARGEQASVNAEAASFAIIEREPGGAEETRSLLQALAAVVEVPVLAYRALQAPVNPSSHSLRALSLGPEPASVAGILSESLAVRFSFRVDRSEMTYGRGPARSQVGLTFERRFR